MKARRKLVAIFPDRGQKYIGWGKGTKAFPNHIARRVYNKDGSIRWKNTGWNDHNDFDVIQDPHNPRQVLVYVILRRPYKEPKRPKPEQKPELPWVTELFEKFSVKC